MISLGVISRVACCKSWHKHLESEKQFIIPFSHNYRYPIMEVWFHWFTLSHMLTPIQSTMAKGWGTKRQTYKMVGVLPWVDGLNKVSSTCQNKPEKLALSSPSRISGNWNPQLSNGTQVLNGIKTIASDCTFQACQLHHPTKVIYCLTFKYF